QQSILGRQEPVSPGKTREDRNTGFVLGVRLRQPAGDGEDGWRLDFLVSAVHDPSLQVILDDWWELPKCRQAEWLKYFGGRFEQNLLVAMGHAARMCPLLWQGMETSHPVGVDMDLDMAYGFLRNDAPVLESAGFRVLLPSWWTPKGRQRARLRINASGRSATSDQSGKSGPAQPSSGHFALDSVVQFRYELSVGGEAVSPEEWRELVSAKSPLVRFRGEWMELDRDQMARTLALWQEQEDGRGGHAVSIGRMLKEISEANGEITEFVFDEVLDGILARLERKQSIQPLEDPNGLRGELRTYQKQGVSWLSAMEALGLNPCLADDMGLGKTVQVIALLLHERKNAGAQKQSKPRPTLLIAPTSVLGNWEREIGKFAPRLDCVIHHGGDRIDTAAGLKRACRENDVLITSFAIARKDCALLKRQKWRRIVVDEAQNIKNPQSAQARAVCSLEAAHRLALTGTPVENRLMDLWSLFHFLNPGYLGNRNQFRKAYELPVQRNRNAARARQLQKLVHPFILRRMKTDPDVIGDLPEKVEQKVYCNLTREQASLYQATVDEVEERIGSADGMERRGLILSTLTRLKQICNHPSQFLQDGSPFGQDRSHKLARLSGMVEEALGESASMLVFTQFAELGDRLERFIRETHRCPVHYLHGGTGQRDRQRMIEGFQNPDTPPGVFVLSLKAGGTGITLTRASHVFHFDRWWNPAVENQATDRAYRIGQKNPVFVHKMVTLGTLEERIDAMIEDKQALAESIVGTGENWLTELDDGEFRQLISLNRRAIMEAA
ncbi:MAG: DEAD/DEAH box helicase, partial [Gammaproteobacteria bacterium]|nr:DEAD/DEAH box helicase [Gammaproteobacteria bacterium]